MKRTLSLILAMLMVVTIFAAAGMAEGETEPAGEPEVVETAAPAAEEPAPAAEEPAPATEEPAPATEEPAPATEEPAPATEEPIAPIAEQPADNGVAPASEPEPTVIHEDKPVSWVLLDCNGGTFQGYTQHPFDLVDGKLAGGLDWYAPTRDGYKFLGWYAKDAGGAFVGEALKSGDEVTAESTIYAKWEKLPRTVTLDATPGNFWDSKVNDNNYTRTVTLTEGDKLPTDLPTPTYDYTNKNASVEFVGWYTQPTTTSTTKGGDYQTWNIQPNGQEIKAGEPVDAGITTLYAGYKLKGSSDGVKTITYYLHANGMGGKTGALEVTRRYEEGGVKFTAEDAAVDGINFDYRHTITGNTEEAKWDELKKVWESETFNGYTFEGWHKADGTLVEGGTGKDPTVQNGEHLYAYWSTDTEEHKATPTPAPTPGAITGMHIDAPYLTIRQDPIKGGSVTIPLFVAPVGGDYGTITWTVEVPSTFDPKNPSRDSFMGKMKTYTIEGDGSEINKAGDTKEEPKFTAKADGLNLVITPQEGCTQVLYVSAKSSIGKETPQPATVVITHTPEEQETVTHAATCTAAGEAAILCAECGEATEVHSIPATGHTYEAKKTGVENGVPIYTETCIHDDSTVTAMCGDINGDGRVSTKDVGHLYKMVSEQIPNDLLDKVGDVNGDGRVSTKDVGQLYKFVSDQIDSIG